MSGPSIKCPLEGALYMFDLGFKVFPLAPNSKQPPCGLRWKEWANAATRSQIEQYGTRLPLANWAVYPELTRHCVLDLDVKGGKNGVAEINRLENEYGPLPQTLTVQTVSGGIHKYYKGLTRSTTGTVASGIDTKSRGGYVLAPGSRINERAYEVLTQPDDNDIPEMPQWFSVLIEKKGPAPALPEKIQTGERNTSLASFAGTMRRRGANHETILAALMAMNESQLEDPLPESEVQHIAQQISAYAPEHAKSASDFYNQEPFTIQRDDEIDYTAIPKRDWIMSGRYVGKFISGVFAPGGIGKSALTMLDAISITTGRPLTGFEVIKRGNVWLYNTEDPSDELHRRLSAIAIHHKINYSKEQYHIYISSSQDRPFIVARSGKDGVYINKELMDDAVEEIKKRGIILLICDPYVRTHECQENSNEEMDKVIWCFSRIAARTGCAVGLVHHTSKAGSRPQKGEDTLDMYAGRGATALINAARICHVLRGMSKKEAPELGVPVERRGWYIRLDNVKANLQPPAESAVWFEKHKVTLINHDDVGTVEPVQLKSCKDAQVRATYDAERQDLARCLEKIMVDSLENTLAEVTHKIIGEKEFNHLFPRCSNFNSTEEKFKRLLEESLQTHEAIFRLDVREGRRPKFFVIKETLTGFLQ